MIHLTLDFVGSWSSIPHITKPDRSYAEPFASRIKIAQWTKDRVVHEWRSVRFPKPVLSTFLHFHLISSSLISPTWLISWHLLSHRCTKNFLKSRKPFDYSNLKLHSRSSHSHDERSRWRSTLPSLRLLLPMSGCHWGHKQAFLDSGT